MPVERDELKIKERGKEIDEAVARIILEENSSGPEAVSEGVLSNSS